MKLFMVHLHFDILHRPLLLVALVTCVYRLGSSTGANDSGLPYIWIYATLDVPVINQIREVNRFIRSNSY